MTITKNAPARNVILILGDQLTPAISSLNGADPDTRPDPHVRGQCRSHLRPASQEKDRVSVLRHAPLRGRTREPSAGASIIGPSIATENRGSFAGEVERAVQIYKPQRFIVTEPGEWRVLQMMRELGGTHSASRLKSARTRASAPPGVSPAGRMAQKKSLRMEYFYREIRRENGVMMRGDEPEGGQWNYDAENRERLPDTIALSLWTIPNSNRMQNNAGGSTVLKPVSLNLSRFASPILPLCRKGPH